MAKRNYWRLRRRINRPRDFISSIRSLRFSRQGLSLKRRWSLLHALLHGVAHPGPIDGEARRDGQHAELLEAHAAHRGVRRRSEERRVGKECRAGGSSEHSEKKDSEARGG